VSAGWTELPAHIHHRTETLAPFLAAIGAVLSEETDGAEARPFQAQFCLT
jgi:putative hydrolase of the HAD superfamily